MAIRHRIHVLETNCSRPGTHFEEKLETGHRIITNNSLVSTDSVDFESSLLSILFDFFIVDIAIN